MVSHARFILMAVNGGCHKSYRMACVLNIKIIEKRNLKHHSEADIQVFRTLSKILLGSFAKIGNDFWLLTIFGKRSVLYVWQGFEYVSAFAECRIFFTVEYILTTLASVNCLFLRFDSVTLKFQIWCRWTLS